MQELVCEYTNKEAIRCDEDASSAEQRPRTGLPQGFQPGPKTRLATEQNRACQELARVHTIERACDATRGASRAAQTARPLIMVSMPHKNLEST